MILQIPHLKAHAVADLQQLSQILDHLPAVPLSNHSWPEISTLCKASVVIAHTGQHILLKFKVSNDYFRTASRKINGEVHLDNCVEFFISFDHSDTYYNIEFNCLGIGKMAYGRQKGDRVFIEDDAVRKIQTLNTADRQDDSFNWEMTWLIPAEVFTFHQIKTFDGLGASGNFYKCGDALPQPHFLSWNRIDAELPDFHRPDCFGKLSFLSEMIAVQETASLGKVTFLK
jgi:hypothetical protein